MLKTLVVEDDAEFRQFLQFVLERAGYLVVTASTIRTAVEWLKEPGKPDLIFLDLRLPDRDRDGLDLCRALKRDVGTRKIPVIILTAHAGNELRIEAGLAHADLVLTKPIKGPELVKAARMLLDGRPEDRRGMIRRAGMEIDPGQHTVFYNGKLVSDLSVRLFDLLYLLGSQCPNTLNRKYILSALNLQDRDREVDVLVSRLRKRLLQEFAAPMVVTIAKEGYRLDLPLPRSAQAV